MSKENEPPGLLSKIGRFVRNPLTNWSDLDQPELDKESKYSKQMLKEMIERKRRNDFVRKREFDQLRKLRRREASGALDAAGRPSFFQSSYTTKPDDRAGTLKKIDEIEAQMSQQWWKTKSAPGSAPGRVPSGAIGVGAAQSMPDPRGTTEGQLTPMGSSAGPTSVPSGLEGSRAYAQTVPAGVNDDIEALLAATPRTSTGGGALAPDMNLAPPGFNAATLLSDKPGFVHDPDLEEAAIRYANGDFTGTKEGLRQAVAGQAASAAREETWLTFFDFHRVMGDQDGFESLAIDFAGRFGRSAPPWLETTGAPGARLSSAASGPAMPQEWVCPEVLDLKAIDGLVSISAGIAAGETLVVRWDALQSVHTTVLSRLATQFAAWCESSISLRFSGVTSLEFFLRAATPSGDRKVDQAWWRVRLDYLRLNGQADEFELVALDFCVTYEVSPPSWQRATCQFLTLADGAADETMYSVVEDGPADVASGAPAMSAPAGFTPGNASGLPPSLDHELSGELLGDPAKALQGIQAAEGQRALRVGCAQLKRVDFPAAGALLNWAAALESRGCEVQFVQLNRLVAIFFNVIGINEHAKVLARSH